MKHIKSIIEGLTIGCYIIVTVYAAIALPIIAGFLPVVVLTGSMEPTYPVGSIIYYKEAAFEKIRLGDAITFLVGENTLVTHRIVQIDEKTQEFVTRGDANDSNDASPVRYKNVKGVVAPTCLPYVGHFVSFLNTNKIVILFIASILVLKIIFSYVVPDEEIEIEQKVACRRSNITVMPEIKKLDDSYMFDLPKRHEKYETTVSFNPYRLKHARKPAYLREEVADKVIEFEYSQLKRTQKRRSRVERSRQSLRKVN